MKFKYVDTKNKQAGIDVTIKKMMFIKQKKGLITAEYPQPCPYTSESVGTVVSVFID